MIYQKGYVYHIKDEYFKKANDKNLMINKEKGQYRPTYYCEKDNNTGLIWVVPMSTKYNKFENEVQKKINKYGKCNTIVLGSFDKKKAAFLIQNMFPITEKYLDHIHTRNNRPVPVSHKIQNNIKTFVKEVRALTKRGHKIVFPDIERLEKMMLSELEVEKAKNKMSLSDKIKLAQDKANQQNANRQRKPIQNKDRGKEQ